MLRRMTWQQFLHWQAYDAISPIGDRRGDWQAASICAAFMNATAARSGSKQRFRTSDFLLEFTEVAKALKEDDAPAPAPDWQRMKMSARMFAALANAKEKAKATKATRAGRGKTHGRRR